MQLPAPRSHQPDEQCHAAWKDLVSALFACSGNSSGATCSQGIHLNIWSIFANHQAFATFSHFTKRTLRIINLHSMNTQTGWLVSGMRPPTATHIMDNNGQAFTPWLEQHATKIPFTLLHTIAINSECKKSKTPQWILIKSSQTGYSDWGSIKKIRLTPIELSLFDPNLLFADGTQPAKCCQGASEMHLTLLGHRQCREGAGINAQALGLAWNRSFMEYEPWMHFW